MKLHAITYANLDMFIPVEYKWRLFAIIREQSQI